MMNFAIFSLSATQERPDSLTEFVWANVTQCHEFPKNIVIICSIAVSENNQGLASNASCAWSR